VIAVDTSVVVAGFASWHEGHRAAAAALARRPRVPAHVLVEAYSVLTRLPLPHRAPADLVATFLTERFPEPPLVLPARGYLELVESSARTGLAGGAVYDALIAATARHANATLLTRDERALVVYERMKVRFEVVK
jgi:predicted nucleic acid-binding protein